MDAVERFARLHRVAALLEEVETGGFFHRRSGAAGDAGDAVAIDGGDGAAACRRDLPGERAWTGRGGVAPLGVYQPFHRLRRRAAPEQGFGAFAGFGDAVEIEHPGGEHQRLVAQVGGCVRIVRQHLHHVARFQRRTDAAADRLGAVGDLATDVDAEPVRRDHEQPGEFLRLGPGGHLGGRPDRNVEHDMGHAERRLLGQDRGHREPVRDNPERTGDGIHHVVDGRMAELSVPDDAAADLVDRAPDLARVEIDPGQHLHRVRRAGGRGDRARGGLGDGEPVRDDDRYNHHGHAGPGDAPHRVLVDDDLPRPGDFRGALGARPGERDHLVVVERLRGRDQKTRRLARGVAAGHHVLDHRVDFGRAQATARDPRPERRPAGGLGRAPDRDRLPLRETEQVEGVRRQRERIRGDERGIVDDVERAGDAPPAARHLDLTRAEETLRVAFRTAAVEVGDRLPPGVDGEPGQSKHRFPSARR